MAIKEHPSALFILTFQGWKGEIQKHNYPHVEMLLAIRYHWDGLQLFNGFVLLLLGYAFPVVKIGQDKKGVVIPLKGWK